MRVYFLLTAAAIRSTIPAPPLPSFEFRTFVAGQPEVGNPFIHCAPQPDGTKFCRDALGTVAGKKAVTVLKVYNNMLVGLYVETERDDYDTVLAAYTVKYGTPCKIEHENWESRAGAKLDSARTTWCFKTGRFIFREVGTDIDHSTASYRDNENGPPPAPPKIDF